jgi:pentatricopeptide repeat protein
VTQGARGIAYSCLIDVLTQQGSYAEGCDALKSALCNGVHLSDINRTALKRLKEGLEGKGFLFPYDIPKKMETPSECDSELSMAVACIQIHLLAVCTPFLHFFHENQKTFSREAIHSLRIYHFVS